MTLKQKQSMMSEHLMKRQELERAVRRYGSIRVSLFQRRSQQPLLHQVRIDYDPDVNDYAVYCLGRQARYPRMIKHYDNYSQSKKRFLHLVALHQYDDRYHQSSTKSAMVTAATPHYCDRLSQQRALLQVLIQEKGYHEVRTSLLQAQDSNRGEYQIRIDYYRHSNDYAVYALLDRASKPDSVWHYPNFNDAKQNFIGFLGWIVSESNGSQETNMASLFMKQYRERD